MTGVERVERPDRARDQWGRVVAWAVVASVVIHAGVLAAWPAMAVPTVGDEGRGEKAEAIELLGAVTRTTWERLVDRPALPVLAELHVAFDATPIVPELKPLDAFSLVDLPPLPVAAVAVDDEWADYRAFSPSMVEPEIVNREQVARLLKRRYERILSSTGATGRVMLTFWIDEEGRAQRVEVAASSGHDELDELALHVSEEVRFTPAIANGAPVRVKVELPFSFQDVVR